MVWKRNIDNQINYLSFDILNLGLENIWQSVCSTGEMLSPGFVLASFLLMNSFDQQFHYRLNSISIGQGRECCYCKDETAENNIICGLVLVLRVLVFVFVDIDALQVPNRVQSGNKLSTTNCCSQWRSGGCSQVYNSSISTSYTFCWCFLLSKCPSYILIYVCNVLYYDRWFNGTPAGRCVLWQIQPRSVKLGQDWITRCNCKLELCFFFSRIISRFFEVYLQHNPPWHWLCTINIF